MITRIVRIFLAMAAAVLLAAAAYFHAQSASIMTDAAKAFLASLTAEQRRQATFDLGDAERMNWFYTPVSRKGLPLRQMRPAQRQLAMALLSAGLSQRGMIKATTIMSLEDVLNVIEKGDGTRRDPDLYFVSIFGTPVETGTWGFRFEGHHVSQNFTIVDGKVAGSPSFFGANPAEVKEGPRKGLRPLSREDDLAHALILGLSPAGRNTSIVDKTAQRTSLPRTRGGWLSRGSRMVSRSRQWMQNRRRCFTTFSTNIATTCPIQSRKCGKTRFRKRGITSGLPGRVGRDLPTSIITAFSRPRFWLSSTKRRIMPIIFTRFGGTSTVTSVRTYSPSTIGPATSKAEVSAPFACFT